MLAERKRWKKIINHPHTYQGKILFDSKPSPAQFFVAEVAEVDAHDWIQGNCKGNILKSGCEKLTDFCGTCHGKSFFQLVMTMCWLQFFSRKIQTFRISGKTFLHTFHIQINLVSKQLKWVKTFKLAKCNSLMYLQCYKYLWGPTQMEQWNWKETIYLSMSQWK